MSVSTAEAGGLSWRVHSLKERLVELLSAGALMLSAVTLATAQFFSHAMPSPDIVYVPAGVVLYAILFGIILPTLVLGVIDRIIAASDSSGVWSRRFRIGVLSAASVLLLRQFQVYFGPVGSLLAIAGPAEGIFFGAIAAGIAYAVIRWYEPVRQFYATAAPVALILVFYTSVQMVQGYELPPAYSTETPAGSKDSPPVFVIVADELSYDVLSDSDEIDPDRFPNFAALADDGAWLTNATTNNVHTTFIVPSFMKATADVGDDYQLRLYSQYRFVESLAWDHCGTTFTCRGAAYLGEEHTAALTGTVIRRALFQATPSVFDSVIGSATGWLQGGLDSPSPAVDRLGMHTFTNAGFEEFLGDVDAEHAKGSLYFYHVLLPHTPFVFGADGAIASKIDAEDNMQRYGEQTQYLDSLLGRLTDRLKAEGIYDEATIIITGDHGRRPWSIANWDLTQGPLPVSDETPHVPFIVKSPYVEAGVYDVDYQHQDFEATFLDALGRSSLVVEGISAFALDRPDREKDFVIDQQNERYWRYVYNEDTGAWDFVEYVEEPLVSGGFKIALTKE
jgi:hypothetical protein